MGPCPPFVVSERIGAGLWNPFSNLSNDVLIRSPRRTIEIVRRQLGEEDVPASLVAV